MVPFGLELDENLWRQLWGVVVRGCERQLGITVRLRAERSDGVGQGLDCFGQDAQAVLELFDVEFWHDGNLTDDIVII